MTCSAKKFDSPLRRLILFTKREGANSAKELATDYQFHWSSCWIIRLVLDSVRAVKFLSCITKWVSIRNGTRMFNKLFR